MLSHSIRWGAGGTWLGQLFGCPSAEPPKQHLHKQYQNFLMIITQMKQWHLQLWSNRNYPFKPKHEVPSALCTHQPSFYAISLKPASLCMKTNTLFSISWATRTLLKVHPSASIIKSIIKGQPVLALCHTLPTLYSYQLRSLDARVSKVLPVASFLPPRNCPLQIRQQKITLAPILSQKPG